MCAGNVSSGITARTRESRRFNSYVCGECFGRKLALNQRMMFQLIYVRGMFQKNGVKVVSAMEFQLIYARGMFRIRSDAFTTDTSVSTHICTGNVSVYQDLFLGQHFCFNSYMCGECFIRAASHVQALFWFQLIYVRGMFLPAPVGRLRGERFNSYMCEECFEWAEVDEYNKQVFRFIYARGMFLFIFDNSIVLNNVSTHICAGNVSVFMRGFAILDGANPQELDCSLRVRAVIYRMR